MLSVEVLSFLCGFFVRFLLVKIMSSVDISFGVVVKFPRFTALDVSPVVKHVRLRRWEYLWRQFSRMICSSPIWHSACCFWCNWSLHPCPCYTVCGINLKIFSRLQTGVLLSGGVHSFYHLTFRETVVPRSFMETTLVSRLQTSTIDSGSTGDSEDHFTHYFRGETVTCLCEH